ncbi:MAG: GspMb/PilO family protein, partial [Longimicrobiaceae bacterium]
ALLAQERTLLAGARAYRGEFGAVGARFLAGIPRLLPGATAAAAHAALARRVDRVAAEGSVLVTRLEPLAVRSPGHGYVALPLQVEGESDLEGLLGVLAALESGPTLVHLEALSVERRGRTGTGEELAFRFTAVGFSLDEAPADTAASAARGTR